jgi:hypothetical protein
MTPLEHATRLLVPVVVVVLYRLVLAQADRSRAMEAVLGLSHGDAATNAALAAAAVGLRFMAYAAVGGTLVAWPLEAWLRKRAATAAP